MLTRKDFDLRQLDLLALERLHGEIYRRVAQQAPSIARPGDLHSSIFADDNSCANQIAPPGKK